MSNIGIPARAGDKEVLALIRQLGLPDNVRSLTIKPDSRGFMVARVTLALDGCHFEQMASAAKRYGLRIVEDASV